MSSKSVIKGFISTSTGSEASYVVSETKASSRVVTGMTRLRLEALEPKAGLAGRLRDAEGMVLLIRKGYCGIWTKSGLVVCGHLACRC
jgi:hypothetical protein